MADRQDGGPAFPTSVGGMPEGMSLRDHFAGLAMKSLIGRLFPDPLLHDVDAIAGLNMADVRKDFSEAAYLWADAMLAARAKRRP